MSFSRLIRRFGSKIDRKAVCLKGAAAKVMKQK